MGAKRDHHENEFALEIDGDPVRVTLVPRANARRYILRVRSSARDVQLTVPPHGNFRDAQTFVLRHRDWIRERLARLPEGMRFEDGAVIPFKGADHLIEHRPGARGVVWIEPGAADPLLEEDALPRICVAGRYLHVRRRVRDWLKGEAEKELAPRVREYARRAGVSFNRLSIRDQKSRWGACSSSGTLTFSWRLVLAPEFVIDYLAAHEVNHLREMNHSRRYWRLLRELCPDTDRAEAWLKAHGRDLHRYDAP